MGLPRSRVGALASALLIGPIRIYQWTLKPLMGWRCRHLPTCSAYAIEAIEKNGPWKGFWLGFSRILRCNPWGTHGYDPVPDLSRVRHPLYAAYRYGRWTGQHMRDV